MTTYQKKNPETIKEMFGSIAKQYDRTNAILSFNLHRYWNQQLVKTIEQLGAGEKYLDLCCGTAEIAHAFLHNKQFQVDAFLLDFCNEMLDCARTKLRSMDSNPHTIRFIQADAQQIPLPDQSIDTATIAYGVRNIKSPTKCVKEVLRVLKPGGVLAILELTQPSNPLLRFGHQLYLRTFLPLIGKLTAANKKAYEYLCSSIQAFIPPKELEKMLIDAGFIHTNSRALTGGIATIISGRKGKS